MSLRTALFLMACALVSGCRIQNEQRVLGSVVCEQGSATLPANENDVLSGRQYWDATGLLRSGTMLDLATWNVSTAFNGPGYVSSVTNLPPSHLNRDFGATQATLAQEKNDGLPSGYRDVPRLAVHDEGFYTTANGCAASCSSMVAASRPSASCGTTQATVSARLADCLSRNPTSATWNGNASAVNGEAAWKLVTFDGSNEVWVDTRTGLLWSDRLGADNWCKASGSSAGGPFADADSAHICDNGVNQDQTTPVSWCTEDSGFSTPGALDSKKGGMRRQATATSPSVKWRLPTKNDWLQAEIDGIRFVLPSMNFEFWAATILSTGRDNAMTYNASAGYGEVGWQTRQTAISIRCVGRANWE